MPSLGSAVQMVAGYKDKDWYIATHDTIVTGPFRTLREACWEVWRRTGKGWNPKPRNLDTSLYTLHPPSGEVFYVGLGDALFDQSDAWRDALMARER